MCVVCVAYYEMWIHFFVLFEYSFCFSFRSSSRQVKAKMSENGNREEEEGEVISVNPKLCQITIISHLTHSHRYEVLQSMAEIEVNNLYWLCHLKMVARGKDTALLLGLVDQQCFYCKFRIVPECECVLCAPTRLFNSME